MSSPFPDPAPAPDACCREHIAFETARDLLISRARSTVPLKGKLLRVEVDIPPVCLLDWLAAQHHISRYYWCDRQRNTEMAGIGEAHVIVSEDEADIHRVFAGIQRHLPEANGAARYYGGFRFQKATEKDGLWNNFKACRFVVPLVELYRAGHVCRLACTLNGGSGLEAACDLLQQMPLSGSLEQGTLPTFHDRRDTPNSDEWQCMVDDALAAIRQCAFEKVVLARKTTFHASRPVDPLALVRRLSRRTGSVYLFCFQPAANRAFLGASPECLYRRDGNRLESEALAGTRPRGETDEMDRCLELDLASNDKDRREHQIVVDTIRQTLHPFCTSLETAAAPGITKLANCQHLLTPVKGVLKPGIKDDMLLESLHPTPAVGGKPKEAALRWIRDNEPFERGVYASPTGWIGKNAAEFCVGIRSGLVLDDTLTLYAGAGIVPGSEAGEEWRELDAKMAQFLTIILEEH